MSYNRISYQESGYFSKLIVDYLEENPELKSLYNRFPKIENFKAQIEEKSNNFNRNDNFNRQVLASELERQYNHFEVSERTLNNIKLLNHSNTFTITTGHQLNVFTGPLYFIYKIISTINLCELLQKNYPDYNFVPVYWMATEDHDFEEINHFHLIDKTFRWNKTASGPVGRLSTEGLEHFITELKAAFGPGENAKYLVQLFETAYTKNDTLADAMLFLVNQLFGAKGLIIIDGDTPRLKSIFAPFMARELQEQVSKSAVSKTLERFPYDIQVNPRDINLFYMEDNLRERIVFENGMFKVNATSIEFSKEALLETLKNHPEKFSPNVILRPLYQEVILPNLCYIGGGGEIAYWMELKNMFTQFNVPFPMLLLRNSALIATEKQIQKATKLELTMQDLFKKQTQLIREKTAALTTLPLDFSAQKEFLKKQFDQLTHIASQTDKSFAGAVKAQEAKQIKGLENLEKKLLRAEKKKHADDLQRITLLQNELFPNGGLQERRLNFSVFYTTYGSGFFDELYTQLQPLENDFTVIKLT